MAIKKFNANNTTSGVVKNVTSKPVIKREEVLHPEEVTPIVDEQVEEETTVEEEIEETIEEQPKETVEEPKTKNNKKTLRKSANTTPKVKKNSVGNVYPKDKLYKDFQEAMGDDFEISLEDCKRIFNAMENVLGNAADVATVRFCGGLLKTIDRKPMVRKSPAVDYYSYTGESKVLTLTSGEVGQPDKCRGQYDDSTGIFTVSEIYDYETGKWVSGEGEIEMK